PASGLAAPGGEGTPGAEELTVSPAPLVFPTTTKWMNTEETLTVTNTAGVPVSLFGTNFEGPGAGAFGTNGSSCGAMLMAEESCTVAVRFSPQSAGEQRASIHLAASVPSGGPTVELEGLGALPELLFEPGSFDFGLTQAGEGGERTRMILRNVGPAATQVGIETSGGSGAFSIGESDCWGATLAAGGTCSLQVNFRPNETGPYVGEVRANSAGIAFGAELSGRGGRANLIASTNPLDFGSAAVGSHGEPRTVTIENSGDVPGGFFIAVISGGDSASFQLLEEDCTGFPILPAAKCQAAVRFQPTTAGLRKANLSFFGDSEGGQQIVMSGTGIDPGVPAAAPSVHSFGAEATGSSGELQPFTFTNESAVATELGAVSLGGENPDQFPVARDGCSGTTLAPGASCQVGVRFAPLDAGTMSAVLRLGSTGGVATAALSGYAEAAPVVDAAFASGPRAGLRLARRPLHLSGSKVRVGTVTCPFEESCEVVTRATIVTRASARAVGARRIGPWSTTLHVPAGGRRDLVLRLPTGEAAPAGGRLLLRWRSRSGTEQDRGSAEVPLR
ncbi:MAG TPA: choice-of-anchor D domain-containing protein, partial [Solirubrobacterales bacterium]|nr:choice-of-anchor D domain-containing protein [Solirubrobacterales bacterium]